jgi:hypothetical protein
MTQFGFFHAAALSIALILILTWTLNRIIPRIGTRSLTSVALVLVAIYAIAKLGLVLSAPRH